MKTKKLLSLILAFLIALLSLGNSLQFLALETEKLSNLIVEELTAESENVYHSSGNAQTFGYFTYTVSNGEVTITDCDASISGAVTIPSTLGGYPVTSIGSSAFYGCTLLKTISVGSNVESIGQYAFSQCSSLTFITLPASLTNLSPDAFTKCISLTEINVSTNNTTYSSNNGILFNKERTKLVSYPAGKKESSYTIPSTVSIIGEYAFTTCEYLKEISIPDTVTLLEGRAFYNSDALYSVNIGNGIKTIDFEAFRHCDSLNTINLGEKVESIGYGAFANCISLESISIPKSVTDITYMAFYDCTSLKRVDITDITAWCNICFDDLGVESNPLYYAKKLYLNGALLTDLVLPKTIKSIGQYAFYNCTSLTSVTIPEQTLSIGYGAFSSCTSLKSVDIGKNVENIGSEAFYDCTSLNSIAIPDSVMNIGYDAFENTAYFNTSSNWENSVLYINNHLIKAKETISGNYSVKSGTKSIAAHAFSYCNNLTGISLPDSITSIGQYAFYNSGYYNNSNNWENHSLYNGKHLISVKPSAYGSYAVKSGTLTIAGGAFSGCYNITSITIPSGVISIGNSAFADCSGLRTISIPDSVICIGEYAFYYCYSLKEITLPANITNIKYWTFFDCSSLESITIPESVEWISALAFPNNEALETVNFLGNEEQWNKIIIGAGNYYLLEAQLNFEGIIPFIKYYIYNKTVTISGYKSGLPDSIFIPSEIDGYPVKSIGSYAFKNCSSLTSVTIPDSVTSIGYSAFENCSSLTSVTIGNGVTNIGFSAFKNCNSLTSITIPDNIIYIEQYAFYNTGYYNDSNNWENNVLYIGNHLIEAKTILSGSYDIESGTKTIADYAFYQCWHIKVISLPDSVTIIGDNAFSWCSSLTSITIPDSVTNIGSYAISNCASLKTISIPDSVTSISNYAFLFCSSLISINVDANNHYYSSYDGILFNEDKTTLILYPKGKIESEYIIPNSVKSISDYAFHGCESLTLIAIPNGITNIGSYAFENCSSLTSVTIPDSVTSIGYSAFDNCNSLKSIIIPDSVSNIHSTSFKNCASLISINVNINNLFYSSYDGVLFNKDKTLLISYPNGKIESEYTIPDSVKKIDSYAFYSFYNCIPLSSIIIPNSITQIGYAAFYYCKNLKTVYFKGTEQEWNDINIDSSNDDLLNAEIIFNYKETDSPAGDLDGDGKITSADVKIIKDIVLGGEVSEEEQKAYDVNGDGAFDILDYIYIKKLYQEVLDAKSDINGDEKLDSADVVLMKKAVLVTNELSAEEIEAYDLNGDNKLDILDLIRIKKLLANA